MSTITNHYNVPVSSRFYDFLQEDRESADPQVLIASAAKKMELKKEKKSKDKVEKRLKHISESKKEVKEEAVVKDTVNLDDNVKVKETTKVDEQIASEPTFKVDAQAENIKSDVVEKLKTIDTMQPLPGENTAENKDDDRGERGRGHYKRGRRGVSYRHDERHNNDDVIQKSNNEHFQRSSGNNRGRPYRRERTDEREDSFNKVGYFDEQPPSGYRGDANRRRPYNRGARFNRGNDRMTNEEFNPPMEPNEHIENVEKNEDVLDRVATRTFRGRYPRQARGGFVRSQRPETEDGQEFRSNRMGYFYENNDGREYRGRGNNRGGRGGNRRGRGDFRRAREQDSGDNHGERQEGQVAPQMDTWATIEDEFEPTVHQDAVVADQTEDLPLPEEKSTDWGEIEDDPMEVKEDSKVTMTLEEWKAHNACDRVVVNYTASGKEIRKANDGQDVFSGMSEYRKGKGAEEQAEEHEVHEASSHGRQKLPIAMSVRFSRQVDSSDVMSNEDQGKSDGGRTYSRTFNNPRGRDWNQDGPRGGRGAGGGSRGRRGGAEGADFNNEGRNGVEYNRFDRGGSYQNWRGRGGSDYSRYNEGMADHNVEDNVAAEFHGDDHGRGRGGNDFYRRGRGSMEFTRRDRGGSEFARRGLGSSGANGEESSELEFVSEERSRGRGGYEFNRRGRGGMDFSRFDRGGSDFSRRGGRGGSEANADRRHESDSYVEERTANEFVGRGRGGSDHQRRGRGGSDAYVQGRNDGDLSVEDRGSGGNDRSDFVRRDRGGSDFVRRDRGGSEFVRRGRGGHEHNAEGRQESDMNVDDRGGMESNRRGRGSSEHNSRGRGAVYYNSREIGAARVIEFTRDGAHDSELTSHDKGSSGEATMYDRADRRDRGGRQQYNRFERDSGDFNRSNRGVTDYRTEGLEMSGRGGRGRGGPRGRGQARDRAGPDGSDEHDSTGININLCNEDEFPQLS